MADIKDVETSQELLDFAWDLGDFKEAITVKAKTSEAKYALVSMDGAVLEIEYDIDTREMLWTEYPSEDSYSNNHYTRQGVVDNKSIEAFLLGWS